MADLNAYFKSIIDQDREAVVICDLDHTIIYMNPAAVVDYKNTAEPPCWAKAFWPATTPIRWKPSARWSSGSRRMPATTSSIPITTQSTTAMSTWLPCGTRTVP